jgi:hypothetical protein
MGALGYSAIAAAAAGGGYIYYANFLGKAPQVPMPTSATAAKDTSARPSSQDTERGATVSASSDAKAFMGGDQGFVPLTLEKSEDVSHNTKKLYFKVSVGWVAVEFPGARLMDEMLRPCSSKTLTLRAD